MHPKPVTAYPIQVTLMLAMVTASLLHLTVTLPMGYISDDYALMQSAKEGGQLWHLHYAPLMESLWRLAADGHISPLVWHFITLTAHAINTSFVFFLGRRAFHLTFVAAFFAATLFFLVPIGLEALTWISASGYPLMTTGLLGGICLLYQLEGKGMRAMLMAAGGLAVLQGITFLTWDWAIVVAPLFALFAVIATELPKRVLPLILGPSLIIWGWAAALRVMSKYGNYWQNNDWLDIIKFGAGSPLLALFPNVNKEWFTSPWGMMAAVILLGLLLWSACRSRAALASLIAYGFSISPWILGGNPSSRYFYFPAAFLYLITAYTIDQAKSRYIKHSIILVMTAMTLMFTFERLHLWRAAEGEAQKLRHNIERVIASKEHYEKKKRPFVVVNMPDSFGPPQMPLRPQMWYCGLDAVIPGVKVVKTCDCPFIWDKAPNLMRRSEVASTFHDSEIYEVILKRESDSYTFSVIPFD